MVFYIVIIHEIIFLWHEFYEQKVHCNLAVYLIAVILVEVLTWGVVILISYL